MFYDEKSNFERPTGDWSHLHLGGVYFLFSNRKLAYVGRSEAPEDRIEQHRREGRDFDFSLIAKCPDADCKWVELAMIESFRPVHNYVGGPRKGLARLAARRENRPHRDTAYSSREAAEALNICRSTLWTYVRRGYLRPAMVGRQRLFPHAMLEDFVAGRTVRAGEDYLSPSDG